MGSHIPTQPTRFSPSASTSPRKVCFKAFVRIASDLRRLLERVSDILRRELAAPDEHYDHDRDIHRDQHAKEAPNAHCYLAWAPRVPPLPGRLRQSVTPSAAATVCMSLSPRPLRPIRMSLSGPS